MIKKLMILFVLISAVLTNLHASTKTSEIPGRHDPVILISKQYTIELLRLSPAEIRKITGRKMSFRERIAFRYLQWKYRKELKRSGPESPSAKADRTATLAMILGIASFGLVFIPGVGLIAIPLAVFAMLFGGMSVNKTEKRGRAIAGIILGGVLLILVLIALLAYSGNF